MLENLQPREHLLSPDSLDPLSRRQFTRHDNNGHAETTIPAARQKSTVESWKLRRRRVMGAVGGRRVAVPWSASRTFLRGLGVCSRRGQKTR